MKKITISLVLSLFMAISLTTTAGAQLQPGCDLYCDRVTNSFKDLNDYLNGQGDHAGEGVHADAINQQLRESLTAAKEWNTYPSLKNFTYNYIPGSLDNYHWNWISLADKTKILSDSNSAEPEELDNLYYNMDGIYRLPMPMRKLLPALLADQELMDTLDELYSHGGDTYYRFHLIKNAENHTVWMITIFADGPVDNEPEGPTYRITVSAESTENPTFILQKTERPTF